ncbi:FAD-dependent oxidoreductase [Eremococcus coleocola]|uniref:FAD-dependent oxidoreductase n=1 Tax=Eremococcus coleocola TaxID=88132 RepID=UPI0004153218|nr:FAD-dependent oxidoreductase [Eremococcus coleocola]
MSFKPGTYHVSAIGHNGEIPVHVTFSQERIEEITFDKLKESSGLSDKVFRVIPKQIIEGQTLNVDTVSGATFSSIGLLAGVKEAVKEAGGSVSELENRPPAPHAVSKDKAVKMADVLVIGGGAAGMTAALRASELGKKVLLVEKMSFIGGAISISGGNQVVTGSRVQRRAGVEDDSPELMFQDFMKNGSDTNIDYLLKLFSENVGKATDWVNHYVLYDFPAGIHYLAEYQKNREFAYLNGGHGFADAMRKAIKKAKIEVLLETSVQELMVEDGRVVGAIAKEVNGKIDYIGANSVIITTGGYGNNVELLSDELKKVLYYGPVSATGDGISFASKEPVNAALVNMDKGKIYPNGMEISPGRAKSTIAGNLVVLGENALLLNSKGQRVINEKASNKEILEVLLKERQQMLYLFMDHKRFQLFKAKLNADGVSDNDLEKWFSQPDQTPYLFKANNLKDLAKKAKMNPQALIETVNRYNEFVKVGKDSDFNRQAEFLRIPIEEGPYYLVEQKPRFATTLGGLKVNKDLQVLDKDGLVIEGLYAAGETVGGVMGNDSPSGANNAWAITSGMLASEKINSKK